MVISSAKNGDDMRENIGNHPTIWVCFLVQWPRKNGHGSFSDELNNWPEKGWNKLSLTQLPLTIEAIDQISAEF